MKTIKFERNRILHRLENQFWLRLLAFWLDFFIIRVTIVSVAVLGSSMMNLKFTINSSNEIFLVIFVLYSAILESSKYQTTLGKYFLGLKISDTEGNRISFLKASIRAIFKLVSCITIFGALMIDMNKSRQGLHDLVAKTMVKRK